MNEAVLKVRGQDARRIRQEIVKMIARAQSGHLASSLGLAEVLVYFYKDVLKLKPEDPTWPERDYFLVSAGHVCPVWYVILAQMGYFQCDLLNTFRQIGSPLQGHPKRQLKYGIENTSGPLGQGISQAAGIAYGLQKNQSQQRVFVLSSDGEQQEGQVWEAYLMAAHYQLRNLTIIIDVNGIQASGPVKKVMNISDLKDKLLAFNFAVGVCDGNDFTSLDQTWHQLKDAPYPKALLCQTVPGKGVSFMENDYHWHAQVPTSDQVKLALEELEAKC